MPHFHLHLCNSTVKAEDAEGIDAADLGAARDEAIAGIRGFLSHELARGVLDLRGHIEITDDDGVSMMTVPFGDAVEILRP